MEKSTKAFIPLLLIIFIYGMSYFLVFPVFLRLLLDDSSGLLPPNSSMAIKHLAFSLCIGLEPFGYMFGAPIMGTWSDSIGRKKNLLLSLVLTMFGYGFAIIGIVQSQIFFIFLGRLTSGFASSSQSLAQTAVADISDGKTKSIYFSIITAVMTLSMVFGPPIGSYLSDPSISNLFNEATPLYFALALVIITLFLAYYFYSDTHQKVAEELHFTLSNFKTSIKEAFASRQLRQLFLSFFVLQLGWSFFYQDTMIYLIHKYNYSVNSASNFMAYAGICMALGLFGYKYIIKYFSLHEILLWSFVSCLLSFGLWAFAPLEWELYLLVIPGSVAAGLAQPTIMTLLSNAVPKEKQGWVLGFSASAFAAPWCISSFLFGPLSELNLAYPIIVSVVSFSLGIVSLLFIDTQKTQAQAVVGT